MSLRGRTDECHIRGKLDRAHCGRRDAAFLEAVAPMEHPDLWVQQDFLAAEKSSVETPFLNERSIFGDETRLTESQISDSNSFCLGPPMREIIDSSAYDGLSGDNAAEATGRETTVCLCA